MAKCIQMYTSKTGKFCCLPLDFSKVDLEKKERASLVAQWLRIHLPMQRTQVQALVGEDPTLRGVVKPTRHNY